MSTQPKNAEPAPDPNAQATQNGGQKNLDLETIMRVCNFAIELCNAIPVDACEKLNLNIGQKEQIRAMLEEASVEDGKDCMISLPVGLSYTLTQIPSTSISTVVFGAFAVMPFLTGQFFLFHIYKQLDQINSKLDRIITFLTAAKKAELTAQVKVTQNAYKNYEYIMSREPQRNATIGSLQSARTEAIGNIDFYLNELMNAANIPYGNYK